MSRAPVARLASGINHPLDVADFAASVASLMAVAAADVPSLHFCEVLA
jgi:hypothetical protein